MLDAPRPLPNRPAQEPAKPVDDAEPSRLLAHAIRLVRADGQPQSALALLDQQATRLNQSPYRHEALLIRVEALLALKRDRDLLRLLDGAPLVDVAASRSLLVTRGRLRAAAKRCTEAVTDFDRALAEPGRKDRQALLGRALCREALGDGEGAKADRERYRQEASPTPRTPEPAGP
jgi:outer membrane PBP1 activator LpoA protein